MKTILKLALSVLVAFEVVSLAARTTPQDKAGKTGSGLYYETTGAGAPIIFIHGFSLDRRMWDSQAREFAKAHQVIRYDLRGHGKSAAYDRPFTAHEDLLSIYEAFEIESAVLVGLSAGAEIAVDFALEYPARVRQLVLASPGLGGYVPRGSFEWMAPVMAALREGKAREATQKWVETPLMKIANDPQADAQMQEIVLSNWAIWTYDRKLQKRLDPPAIGRLAEISMPALILVGELDLVDTHSIANLLVEQVRDAKRIEIPGVGHLLNLAAPDAFNAELRRFINTSGQ